jgi:hypothetical protein
MPSTIQEISGIHRTLDRLQERIQTYRQFLFAQIKGEPVQTDLDAVGITIDEVRMADELIKRLAQQITGTEPDVALWTPIEDYVSARTTRRSADWRENQLDYFEQASCWIQMSRGYVEYLGGLQTVVGDPEAANPPGAATSNNNESSLPQYDVALSFAGEDRRYARALAELLRTAGFSVFYDEYEQATLWGRNLYTPLSDVYQNKARFCLMFISANYARKLWTKRERESAQARAFRESHEYILPLRLDDTALPGLEDTVGYIDL